jgi:hypothetical protein
VRNPPGLIGRFGIRRMGRSRATRMRATDLRSRAAAQVAGTQKVSAASRSARWPVGARSASEILSVHGSGALVQHRRLLRRSYG